MIKQKEFFEYLRTFFITLLVMFMFIVVLLLIIQHQVYDGNKQSQVEDDSVDIYLVGVLIDKNKYLENQSPLNYKINLKLGTLYEIKKDYKNAEIEYKKSIEKAPCNEFKPQYKLALMYLLKDRLEDAESVMDSIDEEPDETLIKYKADIYEKIADGYYNVGDYEDAIDRYKKSLFYWKIIKDQKEIKYSQDSLASSYVYLADTYVRNMEPQDAVRALNLALTIVDAPILKYKLALLFIKDNPELANLYFEEVFQRAPELINYDAYYKFLTVMAEQANARGDTAQAQLYQFKRQKMNEYYKINILSVDDIVLDDVHGRIKLNNWFKENNIYLEARLKNISKNTIDSLFIEVVFKDNNKVIGDYFNQVIDRKSSLKPGEYSPLVSIRVSQPMSIMDTHPKTITAEIYAAKTQNALKLLLGTVDIQEKVKVKVKKKHPNKLFKQFVLIFDEITSKLPSFLF